MGSYLGKFLIIAGIVLVVLGLILTFTKSVPIGKLPGDIHVQKENFSFYFPITTCIIFSAVITLIMYLINKGN